MTRIRGSASAAPDANATTMQSPDERPSPADRKTATQAANRRLGLILFSIVVVFFLGFFAKMILLG